MSISNAGALIALLVIVLAAGCLMFEKLSPLVAGLFVLLAVARLLWRPNE
jgi:hypothetical protein